MAITALVKFVQGANIGAPGQSLWGVTGTAVTASSGGNNVGVVRAVFTFLWVPEGSAFSRGVQQDTSGGGLNLNFVWTPDSPDAFVVLLTLYDGGGVMYQNIQMVGIPRTSGLFLPGFTTDPSQWNFANNLNYDGSSLGWAPHANALHEWNDPTPLRLSASSTLAQRTLNQKQVGKTIYLDATGGPFAVIMPATFTSLAGTTGFGDGYKFNFKDPNGGWNGSGGTNFPTLQDPARFFEDPVATGTFPNKFAALKMVGGRITYEFDLTNNRWVT